MLTTSFSTSTANYEFSIIVVVGFDVSSLSLWHLDRIPVIPLLLYLYT